MASQPDQPIRVVQYGLGPIGIESARALLERGPGFEVVGAIDIDPAKAGRDLNELVGGDRSGVVVSADATGVLGEAKPDVVVHTTGSALESIRDQLETCIAAGANVVSSSEELFFPLVRHPKLSAALDASARSNGVTILGTGVNPGYVMDTLALTATAVCRRVDHVHAERVVDASRRRGPLQLKIGAGLTPEAFAERKRAGTIGHVGTRESLLFVAHGLHWDLDRAEETLDPVIASAGIETPHVRVEPGQVAGVHHTARGFIGEREVLSLDLKMYVGAPDPHDAVKVDGDPPIDLVIRDGVFGDTATVGALINALPLVIDAEPGLHTTQTLPLPRALGGR